jgi:hypothetical protein
LPRFPPFFDDNPFGIYEKILVGRIVFPAHVAPVCKDIIRKLLVGDRTKRLGNLKVCIGTRAMYTCCEMPFANGPWMKDGGFSQLLSGYVRTFTRCAPMQNGADDVKGHKFFKDVDWETVYNRGLQVCCC